MANNVYDGGMNKHGSKSNVLTSTLIVGCVLALIVIVERPSSPSKNNSTHYVPITDTVNIDTTEAWLYVDVADSFDGIHITDKDTNDIKIILD